MRTERSSSRLGGVSTRHPPGADLPLDQVPPPDQAPPGSRPPCGQTHACKHITLPQTSFGAVIMT